MHIYLKRIYADPQRADGTRILVDRLWPRGIDKRSARIKHWAKDVAPSNRLRRWFQHDRTKWREFKQRYFAELRANPDAVAALREKLTGRTTFVFSAKDAERNNAVALKEYMRRRIKK